MKNYTLILAFVLCNCVSRNINQPLISEGAKLTLVSDQFAFTEGPASNKVGNVYFTDQPNDKIYLWNWTTNKISEFLNKTGRANGTLHFQRRKIVDLLR